MIVPFLFWTALGLGTVLMACGGLALLTVAVVGLWDVVTRRLRDRAWDARARARTYRREVDAQSLKILGKG